VRSTSKNQKKAKDRNQWFIVSITSTITFFIGTILGPGFLWEWRKTGTEQAKYELERITKILDVREKLESNILKILDLYKSTNVTNDEKDPIKKAIQKAQREHETRMKWTQKFPVFKNNIEQLEKILAKLENREPRNFSDLRPPPYNLRLLQGD
jgi:hypothetical protein